MGISHESQLNLLLENFPDIFKFSHNLTESGDLLPKIVLQNGAKFDCQPSYTEPAQCHKEVIALKLTAYLYFKMKKYEKMCAMSVEDNQSDQFENVDETSDKLTASTSLASSGLFLDC